MKRALIQGERICELVNPGDEFPVASPLSWVDVADDTTEADTYENGAVVKFNSYPASSTLAEAVERKKGVLSETFRTHRDAGTTITVSGSSVTLSTTHQAQQELREVVTELSGTSTTQKAVTRSGAPILFSSALAQAALDAVVAHHKACNAAEYDHMVTILAKTTIADVDAYDVSTGWPS